MSTSVFPRKHSQRPGCITYKYSRRRGHACAKSTCSPVVISQLLQGRILYHLRRHPALKFPPIVNVDSGIINGPPPPPTGVVAPSSTPTTSGTTAPPPFTPEQLSWLTHRFPGTSGVGHGPDPLTTAASTSGKHCAYLCRL